MEASVKKGVKGSLGLVGGVAFHEAALLQHMFDVTQHGRAATQHHPVGVGVDVLKRDAKRNRVTHSHPDHSPGAAPLQALCAPAGNKPAIAGLPSAPTARAASAFAPERLLLNNELLTIIPQGLEADLSQNSSLTDYEPAPLPLHVVHREGRQAAQRVRAFIDLAVERLRGDAALA